MASTRPQLAAYGVLAMPLALAALPVYVHVPRFYADHLGMDLALVGAVLLLARVADALIDPLLGHLSDRYAAGGGERARLIGGAVPLLAVGLLLLFTPLWRADFPLWLWLAASLVLVYLPWSLAAINHQAWGAELSADYHQRTRVVSAREAWTLAGVLAGAALPAFLVQGLGEERGMGRFAEIAMFTLFVAASVTVLAAPRPPAAAASPPTPTVAAGWRSLAAPLANRHFRWLLGAFVLDGFALAVSSTLFLFFIADVMGAASLQGQFLLLYFAAGAASLPAWTAIAHRLGKKRSWIASIVVSVAVFGWAFLLGPGDTAAFYVVCALSGLCLGANLALPPSMLADVMDRDDAGAPRGGLYFGAWNLAAKLNLALAAGIALPLLSLLGYQAGEAQPAAGALSALYALVPCVAKLAAAWLLWRSPLDEAAHLPSPAPLATRTRSGQSA